MTAEDQNPNPNPNPEGDVPPSDTPPAKTKTQRKPRSDKGKVKPKAKSVRLPVIRMNAFLQLKDGSKETMGLKAMTATAAEAEVMKFASSKDNAEKMAGAKVNIVALVDDFTIDSEFKVTVKAKR